MTDRPFFKPVTMEWTMPDAPPWTDLNGAQHHDPREVLVSVCTIYETQKEADDDTAIRLQVSSRDGGTVELACDEALMIADALREAVATLQRQCIANAAQSKK